LYYAAETGEAELLFLEWGLQIKTNPTRLTHIPECNGRHHQSIGFNGFVKPISGMYIEKIHS